MDSTFTPSRMKKLFPNNDACLEEIKKMRFPVGTLCTRCSKFTTYYKITDRTAYACKFCRSQVFPLAGTVFEKTTTPLTTWFYALYLMTKTRGLVSAKVLQKELHVTYKTAWRIRTLLRKCMVQNNGDLLSINDKERNIVRKWVLFNKLEITIKERSEVPTK